MATIRVNKAGKRIPNQRRKGHTWERGFAELARQAFPETAPQTRRSQQGAGAIEPDVIWHPGLWTELQASAMPTPLKKLEQAGRDLDIWVASLSDDAHGARPVRVPVAIIKDTKRHKISAHFWLDDMNWAPDIVGSGPGWAPKMMVTLELKDFFALVRGGGIG